MNVDKWRKKENRIVNNFEKTSNDVHQAFMPSTHKESTMKTYGNEALFEKNCSAFVILLTILSKTLRKWKLPTDVANTGRYAVYGVFLLAFPQCKAFNSSNLTILLTQSNTFEVRELLPWNCCTFQRGNLILVYPEYVLNSLSYLSDSPTIHNWVQEKVDKNRSRYIIKGNLRCFGDSSKCL